jgi:SAM-dependent methyltransferase
VESQFKAVERKFSSFSAYLVGFSRPEPSASRLQIPEQGSVRSTAVAVNQETFDLGTEPALPARLERERIHFNKVAIRNFPPDLVMPLWSVRRYEQPSADSSFPLEYAFYLLGDVGGRTIVDIGCGDGLNTVILASLGARVIAIDISDKSLETTSNRVWANRLEKNVLVVHGDAAAIPVEDGRVDGVLCSSLLRHVDYLAAARQIRRILKPGGVASFIEQVNGPVWLAKVRSFLPRPEHVIDDERPLTLKQVCSVSRAVGRPGRSRKFMLTSRILDRLGLRHFSAMQKSHMMDSWILRRFAFARALASPLVWEARKER